MRKEVLYKLDLMYIKFAPMIISIVLTVSYFLAYFDIHLDILNYIFGTSVFSIMHLFLASKVFKFCKYHRMFIYYIIVNLIINMYDKYIGIPIDDMKILGLNMVLSAIFLFLVLYFRNKY